MGEEALSAVWHQAGLNSDRPYNKIIVVVVVEYYYILNKILLLAEGTSASPSGLGNIATLDHFDALAFVK